jgi:hypothetical protein
MLKYIVPILALLLAAAPGQELLVNGDFEQELTTGWVQTMGGSGTHTVNRATGYDPDPDYESYCYQYDNPGWVRLSQQVEVPGPALEVSFRVKLERSTETSCWPASYASICYLSEGGSLLGETRYYSSSVTPWNPSSTFHPVPVTSSDWNDYSVIVGDELSQNLPGVNPADVRRVEIAFADTTEGG